MPDQKNPNELPFSIEKNGNGSVYIVNSEGYRFGKFSEKDQKAMFYQSIGDSRRLVYSLSDIRMLLNDTGSEMQLIVIDNGNLVNASFKGFSKDDIRSEDPVAVPDRHGGMFHDMNILLGFYPDLKDNIWKDRITGKCYINLRGLKLEDRTLLVSDATVHVRELLENDSKLYWGHAVNFKKMETIDKLETIAAINERNPFLEWVNNTPRDSNPIQVITPETLLKTVGVRALGLPSEDDEELVLSEVFQMVALATIERQYKRTVVDVAICLIGPQGTGKTTLCRCLGGEWYRSTTQGVHDKKKFMESVNGGVIVEFREGLQLLQTEEFKDFLDLDYLEYRKPYDRVEHEYDVMQFFIITTNDDQPLTDVTGNRRLIPLYMPGNTPDSIMPMEIDPETYRRIWATMKERYDAGERWRDHYGKVKDLISIMQESAAPSPPYYDRVKTILG